MYSVAIAFTNGTKAHFYAQKFDFDPKEETSGQGILNRITYTAQDGNETVMYLIPKEVAGIIVAPLDREGDTNMRLY